MIMKRYFNYERLKIWVDQVGGFEQATGLIRKKLECSFSKAGKIARTQYPSMLPPVEQKALAVLLKCERDILFPLLEQGEKAS